MHILTGYDVRAGVEHHEVHPGRFGGVDGVAAIGLVQLEVVLQGQLEDYALDALIRRRETFPVTEVGHRDLGAASGPVGGVVCVACHHPRVLALFEQLVLDRSSLGARCTVNEHSSSHCRSSSTDDGAPDSAAPRILMIVLAGSGRLLLPSPTLR